MTTRNLFNAFFVSLAALSTAVSAQSREAAAGGRDSKVVPASAIFPADARKSAAATPESPVLFPADAASSTAPATSQWAPTRPATARAVPLQGGAQGALLQVFNQPAAPPVPDEIPKVPPAPAGENPMPMSPMSPQGGMEGTPMSGATPGMPMGDGMPMTPVDEVFPPAGDCCPTECCSDWCKKCWWFGCHSTCDMPHHFPYFPPFHGYYYFIPYNYVHVFQQKQIAPLLGATPSAPYETTNFHQIYVDAVGEIEANRPSGDGRLKPLEPEGGKLPVLEELLSGKHDLDKPRGRKGKVKPPMPGIDGNTPQKKDGE